MPLKPNLATGGSRPPTLKQIAARSGMSLSSVSRIMSGKMLEHFSETTIQRVRAIAEECRYRPNSLVQGMQSGTSKLVGVLIPAESVFYNMIIAGIHDKLMEKNRVPVVLWTVHDSPRNIGRGELEQIHTLIDLRVQGIILKPIFDAASNDYLHEILDRNIPLVTVDRELPQANCCYVGSDDEEGMTLVLDHLAALGHRKIAYFGPTGIVSTGMHRLHRFRAWMSEHPEITPVEHLIETWYPTMEHAIPLLDRRDRPTAIANAADVFARAIYEVAVHKRIRIPEDLSVVGYGNLHGCELVKPHLTSVDQQAYEIGRSAAQRVLTRASNPAACPRKILLRPELIVRESTAPPGKAVKSSAAFT